MKAVLPVLLGFSLLVADAAAQAPARAREPGEGERGSMGLQELAGTGASVAGIFVGGLAGYAIARTSDAPREDPGLLGAFFGAVATSVVVTPAVVRLVDGGGKPFGVALLGSIAGTAFSLMLGEEQWLQVTLPLGQAVGSMLGLRWLAGS